MATRRELLGRKRRCYSAPMADDLDQMAQGITPAVLFDETCIVTPGLRPDRYLALHRAGCDRCWERPDPHCSGVLAAWLWRTGCPIPITSLPDSQEDGRVRNYTDEAGEAAVKAESEDLQTEGKLSPAEVRPLMTHPRFQIEQSSLERTGVEGTETELTPVYSQAEVSGVSERGIRRKSKIRTVVDARGANARTWITKIRFADVHEIAGGTPDDWWAGSLDLKACYHTWAIPAPLRTLLGATAAGKTWEWNCVVFGLSSAPQSVSLLTGSIGDLARRLLDIVSRW